MTANPPSFAGLDAAKSGIKSLDTWMDLEKDYGLAGFRKATDLRKTWPHLKVSILTRVKFILSILSVHNQMILVSATW